MGAGGPRQKLAGGPERLLGSSPPRLGCRVPMRIDELRPREAAGGTEAGPTPAGPGWLGSLGGGLGSLCKHREVVLGAPIECAEA